MHVWNSLHSTKVPLSRLLMNGHLFFRYSDKNSLLSAVDNVKYLGGELTDYDSMSKVITDMFNPFTAGDVVGVQNIGIIITDGAPNFPDLIYATQSFVVQLIRNVLVFLVCKTPGCTEHCAQGMASPPKLVRDKFTINVLCSS